MYLQRTLKMKITARYSPETEAGASSYDAKEEDVVNETLPAASSTLSKQRRTAKNEAVAERAPICSIYDVKFRNVVAELQLGLEADFRWKGISDLADPLHNVRQNRKNDNGKYNLFA